MITDLKRRAELYFGKAKTIYLTNDDRFLVVHYRDDATAFDGVKKASLARKGLVNNYFNAFIMKHLQDAGIPTHFENVFSANESIVKRLKMIPIECVVRNVATGSLVRRLGIEEGLTLDPPVFEFFLKDDALHDPAINESHIKTFGWATEEQVIEMKKLSFRVNEVLQPLFLDAGLVLVDYKLEFGVVDGSVVLGDEFTPDGCRIWDGTTNERMDKDRFRQDLGGVIEAYEEVARRLGVEIPVPLEG